MEIRKKLDDRSFVLLKINPYGHKSGFFLHLSAQHSRCVTECTNRERLTSHLCLKIPQENPADIWFVVVRLKHQINSRCLIKLIQTDSISLWWKKDTLSENIWTQHFPEVNHKEESGEKTDRRLGNYEGLCSSLSIQVNIDLSPENLYSILLWIISDWLAIVMSHNCMHQSEFSSN